MKKHGFFWIKNKCMPSALRVFCDFSIEKGQSYVFLGPKTNDVFTEIDSVKDV